MHLTTLTTTFILLLTPLATALPPVPIAATVSFNATGRLNGTHPLLWPRGPKSIVGKCIANAGKKKEGACQVGWPTKHYACRNSNCDGKAGEACWSGQDEKGDFVAKCPNNELPYEWEWPWTGK